MLSALDQIDDLIPRLNYGGVNPNNGTRKYKLEVGREGSPVIYLSLWEHSVEDRLSEDRIERIKMIMQLNAAADEASCEVTDFGARKVEFRFWWD